MLLPPSRLAACFALARLHLIENHAHATCSSSIAYIIREHAAAHAHSFHIQLAMLSLSANDSFACFETSASSCCVFGRFHSNFKTATMLLREFRSNDDALSLSCVDLSSQISHSIKASPALFSQHHLKRNWSHTRRRERGGREPRTRMQEKCVQLTSHENKLKVTLHNIPFEGGKRNINFSEHA